jgi:hypothetical protein
LISATISLAAGVYGVEEPGMKEGLSSVHTQRPTARSRFAVTLLTTKLVDKSSGTMTKFETDSRVKATEVIEITGNTE